MPMFSFLKARCQSISYAFQGVTYALRTQTNTWVHVSISVGVIAMGIWFSITRLEWAVLILTMALVWAAEFFNTALEVLLDLLHPQYHPLVKITKDLSAGAVLLTAVFSVLIGLLLLGPPLWERISDLFGS